MSDPCVSVTSEELISCGTHLGPLPLSSGSPDSLSLLTWRCVDHLPASKHLLRVTIKDHLNNKDSPKAPSWLSHILPARNPEEQSLEIVVKGGQLYFRSLRDINSGEELKAWFGQDLADILKLPMIPPTIVDGEKRYECMLCQEQFENPFPVVAHLMYRCRRKDPLTPAPVMHPFRKKNGGGRGVKNFDIATLTDMNTEPEERSRSPLITVTSDADERSSPPPRKRKSEEGALLSSPKKLKTSPAERGRDSPKKSSPPPNGAFKITAPTYHSNYVDLMNPSEGGNGSISAFKKVDKSSSFHHSNIMSNLFTGSLDPRELLFQGPNSFPPFPYAFTPVSTSPTYGGGLHLSPPSIPDTSTSAFAPSSNGPKLTTTASSSHLKMAEELKMMSRKMPAEANYDLGSLRMPTTLHYASPKPPQEVFGAAKTMPGPLMPFLPPSLAALSFPSQNWCAKCNASFRMTSDLVYHMRSHHKRETDPQKLKREEKLRCHICNESFRERHHLTRHMTSHQ